MHVLEAESNVYKDGGR